MARGGKHHRTFPPDLWRAAFLDALQVLRPEVLRDLAASPTLTEALLLARECGVAFPPPSPSVVAEAEAWAERWHLTAAWCVEAAANIACLWAAWPEGHESYDLSGAVSGGSWGWGDPHLGFRVSPWRPPFETWPAFRDRAEAALAEALVAYRREAEAHFEITTGDCRHLKWVIAAVVPCASGTWKPANFKTLAGRFRVTERHMRNTVMKLAALLELSATER